MENRELLEKVYRDRLTKALEQEADSEEKRAAFKDAMDATDRLIEMQKLESMKKDQDLGRILKYVEALALPVGLVVLDYVFKKDFLRQVCQFEIDNTFTTTPGRSGVSGFFRFKH